MSPILEVLVLLMTDGYSQVAAPAKTALEKYRDKQDGIDGCRPLVQLLKENLYSLVTSLPRRIKMEGKVGRVVRRVSVGYGLAYSKRLHA